MSEINNFFTTLDPEDKRTNIPSTISSPVWSGGTATLTSFFTSSVQSASSGDYYYDVYDKAGSDSTREVQFAVSYGHFHGSGSKSTSAGNNPSKAVYRQFRNVCIKNAASSTKFNFNANGDGTTYNGNDIFAISVNRARYREKIDPGNWELRISGSHGNLIKLIDDSEATSDSTIKASQRVFNIVSGSISTGASLIKTTAIAQSDLSYGSSGIGGDNASKRGSLGYFYPELGLIILNAEAVSASCADGVTATTDGINLTRSSATDDNTTFELVTAIISGSHFQARREEQIKSSHYFCRVRSNKYNFSQNPTYYSGSQGELTNTTFVQDPKSYITTVGLYNEQNELLAVAKLSQPLLKSRDREAVIKVRLDF